MLPAVSGLPRPRPWACTHRDVGLPLGPHREPCGLQGCDPGLDFRNLGGHRQTEVTQGPSRRHSTETAPAPAHGFHCFSPHAWGPDQVHFLAGLLSFTVSVVGRGSLWVTPRWEDRGALWAF